MRRFEGQVALITGASRGIGLAIATRLVAEGARVCITARGADALAAAVEELGGSDHAICVAGKADDLPHQQAALDAVLEAYGRLDVLINNAGVNPAYGTLMSLDPGAARKILEVNLLGTLAWVRLAIERGLGADGPASIVNVASITGLHPSPGIAFYGVSKAAIIGLTAQLAAELAPGIRVNAVAPAVVKTKFAAALYEGREEDVVTGYPLGRLGAPEDVAAAVAYLASVDASWVTGQTIVIDGGLTLRLSI
jgi:NAD(P)-dependent dehydrogenase (short-subunit alcohol dehydrogenase family)